MSDDLKAKAEVIYELACSEWEKEKERGFQTLKSIPSSNIKKFLKFYNSLSPEEACRWSNYSLLRVPYMFLQQWRPVPSEEDKQWFRKQCDKSCAVFWGWETWGLRELKNAVSWSMSEKTGPVDISWIPPEKIEWLHSMSTAKASQLRRLIKPLFKEEFDLIPENMGGGEWLYRPVDSRDSLRINLDFGGMGLQLRYEVDVTDESSGIRGKRLSYEEILGVTCLGWNWITEQEAQKSCALLVNFVRRVIEFTSRVARAIT